MSKLSERLIGLRKQRGLTLREAARAIGVSTTRLKDFETGTTHNGKYPAIPKRETILRISDVYRYPAETLLAEAGLPLEAPSPVVPSEVEAETLEVADIFRHLPRPHQQIVLRMLRGLKSDISEPRGE